MADGLNFSIQGVEQLRKNLKFLRDKIKQDMKDILNRNSLLMLTYIRENKLVDKTTNTTLATRSVQLKRSLRAIPAKITETGSESGVSVGTPYARVHFGDRGTSFTITAKKSKFLTIPLPAAKDSRGLARAPARDPIWGPTFISKGVIFGYKGGYASVAGKARKYQPLFALKKSVTVPRRIFPSQLFAKARPQIENDFKEALPKWALA